MTVNRLHHAVAAALLASMALSGCNTDTDDTVDLTPPPAATDPMTDRAPTTDPMTPAADPMMPEDPLTASQTASQTALNVGSITLGTEAGDDKQIAAEMSTFSPTDPIIVSVETDGAASNAEIAARLVYQDGQPAGEESEMVNTTGMETTNLTFTNTDPWPTGEYSVEIWINDTQADSASFNVR